MKTRMLALLLLLVGGVQAQQVFQGHMVVGLKLDFTGEMAERPEMNIVKGLIPEKVDMSIGKKGWSISLAGTSLESLAGISRMVVLPGAGQMLMVNDAAKTVEKTPLSSPEAGSPEAKMSVEMMKQLLTKTPGSQHKTIAGMKSRHTHYRIRMDELVGLMRLFGTDDADSATMNGLKNSSFELDLWQSPDFVMPNYPRQDGELQVFMKEMDMNRLMLGMRMKAQFAVKGQEIGLVLDVEMLEVKPGKVKGKTFRIPRGYKTRAAKPMLPDNVRNS